MYPGCSRHKCPIPISSFEVSEFQSLCCSPAILEKLLASAQNMKTIIQILLSSIDPSIQLDDPSVQHEGEIVVPPTWFRITRRQT